MPEPPAPSSAVTSHAAPRAPWSGLHLWQIQPIRDALIIAILIGLLWLGSRLSIVTVPILLALMLAYLVEPLVAGVVRKRWMRRPFAVLAFMVLSTLVVVVPASLGLTYGVAQGTRLAQTQFENVELLLRSVGKPEDATLRAALPGTRWQNLRDWIVKQEERAQLREAISGLRPASPRFLPADRPQPWELDPEIDTPPASTDPGVMDAAEGVSGAVAEVVSQAVAWLRENAGSLSARAVRAGADVFTLAAGVLGWVGKVLFAGFLTLFFFYFFSVGFGRVREFFKDLVPERQQSRVFHLAERMDRVIAGFVRGRLTICACQILLFTMGYWLIGVPAPFIVGPLVGVLTLAPYAASLGMPVAMLLMALGPGFGDFRDNWWWIVGGPVLMQVLSQVLDDYILSPLIQGKNTDMSMPLILFASIAGGVLGGFYGLLLAIPVAACGKILVEELVMPRLRNWTKGRARDLLPID